MQKSLVQPRRALARLKPYTAGKPIWEVQQELGIDHVIKLASNENPLGASPLALEAIQAQLSDVHRYPDASAILLRQSIAQAYEVPIACVAVSNGADEMIKFISEAYLEIGDEIITPTPTFTEYEFAANLMGANVIHVPLHSDYQYDIEAILHVITPRTKMIYICSPNNPTGTYMSQCELERLMTKLPKGILVVLDAAYSHYADEFDYTNGVSLVREGYPIIILQTFSKIYGLAGLRVGFGLASSEIMSNIQKVREPFNVNALAQAAAISALQDNNHLEQSRRCVIKGRSQLYQIFDKVGLSYTKSASNFILVHVGEQADYIYSKLLQKGIIVRDGHLWGLPQHLRVTVGCYNDHIALAQALDQILE